MNDRWVARSVRLEYMLGEIPLFVILFPALEYDVHFTSLSQDINQTAPPFERFSSEVEALFIRSHPVSGEMPHLDFLPHAIQYVPEQYERYYITLEGSFQDYLNKFSSKSRSTLLRKVKKFAEFSGGEIAWKEYRRPEEMEEFYSLSRAVSQKTYQERLMNLGLPEGPEFMAELKELARQDNVRGYLLFSEGNPIAYLYCPVRDGILFYKFLGYDPEFRNWSPGTVLQHLALESLFAEGKFKMFDFTDGEGPHKEFFSTGSIRCADLYFLRPTLRNRFLLRFHAALKVISIIIVRALDKLGLKMKIKKFIRQWGYLGKLYFPGHSQSMNNDSPSPGLE